MKMTWALSSFAILLSWQFHSLLAESPVTVEARAFRVQAYQTYRHDREQYNALRNLEARVNADWKEAGMPTDLETDLLLWYQQSRQNLQATALPVPPDFSERIAQRKAELEEKRQDRLRLLALPKPVAPPVPEPHPEQVVAQVPAVNPAEVNASPADATTSSGAGKAVARALWKAFTEE